MSRRVRYTLMLLAALLLAAPLSVNNLPFAIGLITLTLIWIAVDVSRVKEDGLASSRASMEQSGKGLQTGSSSTTNMISPPPAPAPPIDSANRGDSVQTDTLGVSIDELEEELDDDREPLEPEPDVDSFITFEDRLQGGDLASAKEEVVRREIAAHEEPDEEPAGGEQGEALTEGAEAHFTAYYPRESAAETAYGLYVYAHIQGALKQIESDVLIYEEQLGGEIPRPSKAKAAKILEFGTLLTVMPEAEGIEFEPVAETRRWRAPFTRFDFSYRAPKESVGEIITGRIAVLVSGIEIASIPFATLIAESTVVNAADAKPANPLAAAKFKDTDPARIYDTIFVSYSRKDKEVAENYRLAQLAVGHEVFMDTYSIRTGEDWRAALARAIDEADIFQLFWSEHSAASENVRDEWDYALHYKCPGDQCHGFIRPVFWEKPMPSPPAELGHLNFRFVPFEADED